MNVVLALSTVSLAVQAAACVVALAISQAPGWRRATIGAVLEGAWRWFSFSDERGHWSSVPRNLR